MFLDENHWTSNAEKKSSDLKKSVDDGEN